MTSNEYRDYDVKNYQRRHSEPPVHAKCPTGRAIGANQARNRGYIDFERRLSLGSLARSEGRLEDFVNTIYVSGHRLALGLSRLMYSSSEATTHESSYLPFMLSSTGEASTSTGALKLRGRRAWNKRGEEIAEDEVSPS